MEEKKKEEKILLEVVTPERLVLREWVDEIVAPGYEGEFGVLPGHTPYLVSLSIGRLSYRKGNEVHSCAISGGFAEVLHDRVIILAETAELASEIDVDRAKRAFERAEKRLKEITLDDEEYAQVLSAWKRALTRIEIGGGIKASE